MRYSGLIMFITIFIYSSCTSNNTPALYEDVAKWTGKTIIFPAESDLINIENYFKEYNVSSSEFTIFRYIPPGGCSSCKLHLHLYSELVKELSDSAGVEVGFLCIVNPDNVEYISHVLKRDNRNHWSVWIDENDIVNKINHFSDDERLQTFLLNKDNKVLAVGDPAMNPKVMQLYIEILTGKTASQACAGALTKLAVDNEELTLGTVLAGDTVCCEFRLRNIGMEPFVVGKVLTSCRCTQALLLTDTIAPGAEAILAVEFSEPEAVGAFERTVSVFGNSVQALTVEISGIVVSSATERRADGTDRRKR